ncbi:MAG: hypothetical protein MUC48_02955 [Leptolyngbya sp. Prado105]|nr:hypothetical protein [Leptolyngbya sp. Prado105]
MSQFHFARSFKNAIAEPSHRYILQRRILVSQPPKLLIRSASPIKVISLERAGLTTSKNLIS